MNINNLEEEIILEEGRKEEVKIDKRCKIKREKEEFYNELVKLRVSGMSLEEIGKKYNVSKQRISQLLGKTGYINAKPILKIKCQVCSETFETKNKLRIYCSTICSGKGRRVFDIPLNIDASSKEYGRLKSKILYKRNPKIKDGYNKKWRDKNKEKVKVINKKGSKKYYLSNKDVINKKARNKRLEIKNNKYGK